MMDPIMQSLFDRKSVRVFTGEPVTAEEKALLLEAAHQAPTGGNQQSYAIIDITDQAIKDQLSELCDHQPFIATADVVLIFCGDSQRNLDTYREAGMEVRLPGLSSALGSAVGAAIVAQNVVVAAEALGLGSCYIGDIMENCERVRELLDSGLPVGDRPVRAEDIVILMRSPNPVLRHYAAALEEQGLPWSADGGREFFGTTEISATTALLQVLDNPRQDVALLAALRSPLFGFTPDRLARLRAQAGGTVYDCLAAGAARGEADCGDFLSLLDRKSVV